MNIDDEDKFCFNEVSKIVGCAFRVYNQLGFGFLEQVYQSALEIELKNSDIPFESQKHIPVYYSGFELNAYYKVDIICYDKIILELKSKHRLDEVDEAQLINYNKRH